MLDVRYMRWLRRLRVVPRWSVVPVLRAQNVAEHSFHVTTLAMWLVGVHKNAKDPKFQLDVLQYALTHDIGESAEGDGPSPTKKRTEPDINDQIKVVVKCADILEGFLFIYEEKLMGNQMGMDQILDYAYNDFVDWWRYFDTGGKHLHSTDIVQSAKLISFNNQHPHPAIDKEEPCLPLK